MLITRCRQLPDGEELVWAEEASTSPEGIDPREGVLTRRGIALAQRSVRKAPLPSCDLLPSTPVVAQVQGKVEWR